MSSAAAAERPAAAPTAMRPPQGEVVVEGGAGRLRFVTFRELWAFREVLGAFTVRQLKVKYKQAAIGIGWSVAQPVGTALVFALFLGHVTHLPSEGAPYLLFALAGMCLWTFFSGAAGHAMESLVAEQVLLRKVYFPREILPAAAVAAAFVDFLPAIAALAVVAAAYGVTPTLGWLLIPFPVALVGLAALGLGLGLSALNVYYRDVRYVVPFVLQLGLFASPVIYPLSAVPGSWRTTYAILNPVAAAIDGLRRIVLHGSAPDLAVTAGAFAWAITLVVAGYAIFKRLERGFSDRV